MEWSEKYDNSHQPTEENICKFVNNVLWCEFNSYLQKTYNILPGVFYSRCSMQKGWNLNYRKRGKSLCRLYPMRGYFIALLVIGIREINEAEVLMPLCSEYTQNLFQHTVFGYNGKWMMMEVRNKDILEDVKKLTALRVNTDILW